MSTKKKIITVITGTRADYGILKSVLRAIDQHTDLRLNVLITGMHLLKQFGFTAQEVMDDGWPICGKVPLQTDNDNPFNQSIAMGRAISGMTKCYQRTKTDIVLVLGDRLEMLAAAVAATASQLLLAHIHGGDIAPGIQDDACRHAISKLAHIHFAASAGAAKRLVQLGEKPQHIYNTGSPALDLLNKEICKEPGLLSDFTGIDIKSPFLVVMQHPAGGTSSQEHQRMQLTLRACRRTQLPLLIIYPNCDTGYPGITKAIEQVRKYSDCHIFKHLPRHIFLGCLKYCRVLVGNSSCGIIESGRLKIPVINIGPRQKKRERGKHVFDCDYQEEIIHHLLNNILKSNRLDLKPCRIYGTGGSGPRIAVILARKRITPELRQKLITY